ncbi:DUF317 domain-containing protein [Streptomyces sp. NPDC046860]|uniref:DUF317 domain-containing protein n=1 Tax=Streptomyces sp. NPDC046860 TaxID=3154495 RepID=UPI0033FC8459
MTSPTPPSEQVRFDLHPDHPTAVTATLPGKGLQLARALLTARGFEALAEHTLVLARIDREEPHWAEQAAHALDGENIPIEITPRLREKIDDDWTWPVYPMPLLSRQEFREVSDEANTIYEDIRSGRLIIHAHADDGWTTVAVGTYRDTGKSVHLHGQDYLRQVESGYDTPASALTAFQENHGPRVRSGPAPATATERQAEKARTSLGTPPAEPEPEQPTVAPQTVPAYAADPGDGDALLEEFLTGHRDWEKWRTWYDNYTHAFRENHTLRIERVHEAHPRETAWTVAAYETPVSDRLWHLTASGATPAPLIQTLLLALSSDLGDSPVGDPLPQQAITEATRPLTDAGWQQSDSGRWTHWQTTAGTGLHAGIQFNLVAAQNSHDSVPAWTLWAGPSLDQPTWTITASTHTPAALLADLAEELAHGTGQHTPAEPKPTACHTTTHASLPEPPAPTTNGRTR